MERAINTCAIIGAGNVATHLGNALSRAGVNIIQVYSRHIDNARTLAKQLGEEVTAIDSFNHLDTQLDFYLIALSDDAVAKIADKMPAVQGIVAHTSGSVGMEALTNISANHGVFYPLQTFSKQTYVDVANVPFFNEASDADTLATLDKLAASISDVPVRHADSEQRSTLHVAAVFACNFPNFLWGCAASILQSKGYEFDVFAPLIKQTLDKALSAADGNPHNVQTGPAMRGDLEVLSKHIDTLPRHLAKLYQILSQSIIDTHK